MSNLVLPTPNTFGLPDRYSQWRDFQESAFERAITSDKRFIAMVAPTGFGKTVSAEVLSMYWGARTAYLVDTKALQAHIAEDFPHRFEVSGKNNYDCRLLIENEVDPSNGAAKCDQAEALCDSCAYKDTGCHYFDVIKHAKKVDHLLPNYSLWFAVARYSEEGFGKFTGLVVDEAHLVPGQLCKSLRIEIGQRSVEQFTKRPLPGEQSLRSWREWADSHHYTLAPRLTAMQQSAKQSGRANWELKELKSLVDALGDLRVASDDWVEDRSAFAAKERVGFEPIWPAPYANRLLFQDIPHVLLMSATLRPKHLESLGLDMSAVEFLEFPSSFPIARRPIIHVKTVQHKSSMSESAKLEAVRRVDQILEPRLDRKWLIDTVSFDRSTFIRQHSKFAYYMIANSPGRDGLSAKDALRQFRSADPPKGLIGPSFRTGYDLPGTDCEVAIAFKVPFLDSRNPLTKARQDSDPLWAKLVVIIELIQFFGRPMRSTVDQCEGFIVDDMFVWLYYECLKLGYVPQWFAPAVKLNQTVPPPLPKLEDWKEGK